MVPAWPCMKYEVLIGIKGKLELHQVNALYLQDRMMMERERERERERESIGKQSGNPAVSAACSEIIRTEPKPFLVFLVYYILCGLSLQRRW